MRGLAYMYFIGAVGLAKDAAKPFAGELKAAENGDVASMSNAGTMYEQVLSPAKDARQSIAWYRKAAEAGNRKAMLKLAYARASAASASISGRTWSRWIRSRGVGIG